MADLLLHWKAQVGSSHAYWAVALGIVIFYGYGYFQKGLWRIPGPFLAGFTDWYRIYYVVVGRRQDVQQAKAHKQYGDVVRYGPNLVSFAHPDAIKVIYGLGKSFDKSPFYLPMQAMSNGRAFASLFTTLGNRGHAVLKRTLASTFSGTSIVSLEPLVDTVLDRWLQQTDIIYAKTERTCDLGWWAQLFAFDAVTNLTYSKTHEMVERHEDVDGICVWLESMFAYASIAGSMPILDQFANKNPFKRFLEWSQLRAPSFATVKFARKRLAERLSSPQALESGKEPDKPDLLARMVQSGQKHPQVLTQKMITAQATSIAFAGSDTTAITITAIIYYLLKSPRCYNRLMEEFERAASEGDLPLEPSEPPTWAQSQKLVYFNACVKEAMRLHPSVGGILERVTPPEGAEIMGKWYSGGTVVGISAWIMHHRPEIFGDDHEIFRPERWIENSPEVLTKMNYCFLAFGAGARGCLGRSISLLEIGKLVPALMRTFEVRLQDPAQDWTLRNIFLVKQYGVHVRFSRRKAVDSKGV